MNPTDELRMTAYEVCDNLESFASMFDEDDPEHQRLAELALNLEQAVDKALGMPSGRFTLVYWRSFREQRESFETEDEAFEYAKRGWSTGELSFEAIEGPDGTVVLDRAAFSRLLA